MLFLSDRSGSQDLWSIGIADGKPIGEAEQIKRNIFAHHAFASDGAYYYSNYEVQMNVYVADLDPASGRLTSQPKRVNERYVGFCKGPYAWSPDGRYLAYARKTNPNDPPSSFVIHTMLNGEEREFPTDGWFYPVWLPDGRSIASLSQRDGKTSLRRVDVQTGEVLASANLPAANLVPAALAADAKTFFYSRIETDTQGNSLSLLIGHDIERGTEKELYRGKAQGSGWLRGITDISPSPDGRQVAFRFSDNELEKSGVIPSLAKIRLMSVSVDRGSPRILREYAPEGGADRMITWTKDGRNVISVEHVQAGRRIVSYPLAGGAPQPSGPIMFLIWELKVSPDGSRIAFSGSEPKSELWVVRNLLAKTNPARK